MPWCGYVELFTLADWDRLPLAPARARTRTTVFLALADETPGIDADIDFHNHVAEASGVRFWLVRGVGRNEQPVACLHVEGLRADHWLPPIFARHRSVLIDQVLPVLDLPANNHLTGAAGENIEVVGAGVLLGIIPNTVYSGETEHRLVAMDAVEHKHGEIAGAHGNGSAAKRLAASAAGLRCEFCRLLRHLRVRFIDIGSAPMHDGRRVRRKLRLAGIVESERHDFRLVSLRPRLLD